MARDLAGESAAGTSDSAGAASGMERVVGIGYDFTEIGQDPATYAEAFAIAGAAGLRRTAHQGENSGPDAIAACIDVLGAERIDHGMSILDSPELTARFADDRIPLTVCPNSNIRIANAFPTLADHVYPAMRSNIDEIPSTPAPAPAAAVSGKPTFTG